METDRHDLADGPELHVAAGAAAELAVGRFDGIATALASTLVHVPGHDLGAAKRRAKDGDEIDVVRVLAAVGAGEDPVAR